MLSPDQLEEYHRSGLLSLPAAISPDDVATTRDRLWAFLGRRDGIEPTAATTWPVGPVAHLQRLTHSDGLDPIGKAPGLSAALDDLIGPGRWRQGTSGVLVTFPQPGAVWTVPHSSWHLDPAPSALGNVVAARVFVILDDLAPHGGGTTVLAGSHRLVARCVAGSASEMPSRKIKSALAATSPWLAGLWKAAEPDRDDAPGRIRRYMEAGAVVGDVPVVVRELYGSAGDVFLMHSDCFHAVAPNCLDRPRLMLAQTGTCG